ncbi:MAG: hypothetical protein COV74_09115 [Candidatus Omnitrophica bacterium CG11_big_fil_rev_8_21_14_0_20_45_26]|uniref:GDP-mannose pyrophosphatase n=1 Tax=Candidatus Abzuiibacterium crystallinum TaxID=1974748 RepID=A0A2H0LLT7_9BACT|nr:MAG: hypothetical protein COV74_09115 [Candidatus Omnitrophica bacterium CG11_big_fil_rev_8_21_14_0_20_45_26]PIW63233.1 MAG: hypothetical protein COW12_11090 [Candidatus Omnitrophica bacterium CG12_big_fil_rev_8_21_14_0_65_45_16]
MKRRHSFPIRKQKQIYKGRAVKLEIQWIESPHGQLLKREIIRHGGSAVIVPVLKDKRLVLVRQHRPATDGYLLEFPAGTLEKGELPRQCAQRELQEEIGHKAGRLHRLCQVYPAPGVSTELMHLFLATDLQPSNFHQPDDDEFLEIVIMSKQKLKTLIEKRKIRDAKTIVGFHYALPYLS